MLTQTKLETLQRHQLRANQEQLRAECQFSNLHQQIWKTAFHNKVKNIIT